MNDTLNYQPRPSAPIPRWSIAAIAGFAFSIVGPRITYIIFAQFPAFFGVPRNRFATALLLMSPSFLSLLISMLAWGVIESKDPPALRGKAFAILGIIVSICRMLLILSLQSELKHI